jgi:hypothetical protein
VRHGLVLVRSLPVERPLSMKKGRASIESLVVHCPVRAGAAVVGGEPGSSLYRLLGEDKADWGSLRWRISLRAVGRPWGRWRLWKRRVGGG